VLLVEIGRQAVQGQAHPARPAVFTDDFQVDGAVIHGREEQRHHRVLPVAGRFVVYAHEAVALAQAGFRGQALGRAEGRLEVGETDHERGPDQGHAQDQVRDRPGRDDRDALEHVLAVERVRQVGRRHVLVAFVGKLHVAAERDHRHLIDRAVLGGARPDRAAEADRELQHLYPA